MNLKLTFSEDFCCAPVFVVNGTEADAEDFGDKWDRSEDTAADYACGDMQFTRKPPTPEVLKRYGITEAEYSEVCGKLEEGLSFGSCGMCI